MTENRGRTAWIVGGATVAVLVTAGGVWASTSHASSHEATVPITARAAAGGLESTLSSIMPGTLSGWVGMPDSPDTAGAAATFLSGGKRVGVRVDVYRLGSSMAAGLPVACGSLPRCRSTTDAAGDTVISYSHAEFEPDPRVELWEVEVISPERGVIVVGESDSLDLIAGMRVACQDGASRPSPDGRGGTMTACLDDLWDGVPRSETVTSGLLSRDQVASLATDPRWGLQVPATWQTAGDALSDFATLGG